MCALSLLLGQSRLRHLCLRLLFLLVLLFGGLEALRAEGSTPDSLRVRSISAPSNTDSAGANKGILEANGGDVLKGQMILEVPVQSKPVPQKVLEYASENKIRIRDVNNKYQDLSTHLGKDLDDYIMETEVQLHIEGDRYMIADILLFKRNQITDKVSDVILIENKLSMTTRFTPNQAEMFARVREGKRLGVKVRSREKTIKRDEIIPLSSTQLIEIRGNGKTTEVAKATLDIIIK